MSYEIAKGFWRNRKSYPEYPNVKQRRLIDFNVVMEYLDQSMRSVLDMGCADGYLLIALREFTDIKYFYGYDLSGTLLSLLLSRWGTDKALHISSEDIRTAEELPITDVTINMGMFPYIFEEEDVIDILNKINSNLFIMRAPCTMKGEDEYVDTYSEDLGHNYSAVYRTVESYKHILYNTYKDVKWFRGYPDEIESKYGTKHYFFICEGRK